MRWEKKKIYVTVSVLVASVFVGYLIHLHQKSDHTTIDEERLTYEKYTNIILGEKKVILYWNKQSKNRYENFNLGSGDIFENCSVAQCFVTKNRQLLRLLTDFDAIIFHGTEMNLNDLPKKRSPHQRYIYYSWETPEIRELNIYQFVLIPNFYNWTMSYRMDSDIVRPYGIIRDIITNEIVFPPKDPKNIISWRNPSETNFNLTDEVFSIIRNKSKVTVSFVNRCFTHSSREDVFEVLKRLLKVEIYGQCGELKCTEDEEKCFDLLEKDYFFYLSFEKSICLDYMTKNLFLSMQKYIIPVVYGGADYAKFLPPHSYINVHDFRTFDELVYILLNLSKNPNEYATYFWWKKYYRVEDSTQFTLCNLCEKLHDNSLPAKSIVDFATYYEEDQCDFELNDEDFLS